MVDKYNVSKSSAANILQRREEFFSDYASNSNKGVKRKHNDESGQTIDQLVFDWFTVQRSKQIAISGPILQEKARQIAKDLGHLSGVFKASNGWLEKFRIRHAISFRMICGESAPVDNSTVEEWITRLLTLLDGYDAKDVFNTDETGLFYRATPDRSLALSKEDCKGGKKAKNDSLFCCARIGPELKN